MLHFEWKYLVKISTIFCGIIWLLLCGAWRCFLRSFVGFRCLEVLQRSKCIKCVQVAPGFERSRYSHESPFQITRGIINGLGSARTPEICMNNKRSAVLSLFKAPQIKTTWIRQRKKTEYRTRKKPNNNQKQHQETSTSVWFSTLQFKPFGRESASHSETNWKETCDLIRD